MSIKNKLILSNILTILIPLTFGLFISLMVFHNFDNRFGAENEYVLVRHLRSAFLRNNEPQLQNLFYTMEARGYALQLKDEAGIYYQSSDFDTLMVAVVGAELPLGDASELSMITANGVASYISFTDDESDGNLTMVSRIATPAAVSEQNAVDSGLYYMRNVFKSFVISIILVVVFTIALTSYMLSRSILKPLKLLREGARQIKNGNLHYRIHYPINNEFGEVCSDFEAMRVSLLALKEEERKYAENRKELVAGITHDLNTPLTSIKGYVSGILDGITHTPEKRTLYLQRINQVADKMSDLIGEMMLYSTLDLNGVTFSFETIDLVAYFNDCLSEVQEEFQKKEIQLHFSADCDSALSKIDLLHFNRVVLNILNNSAKYKKNGWGHIHIHLAKGAKQHTLTFRDDGIGICSNISETESQDFFHVFYRGDKSRNQSVGGNGLGLAIVARIVDAHNGTVRINTAYKDGLEMIVTLPNEGEP